MDKTIKKNEIIMFFPERIRGLFENINEKIWNNITNIRITSGKPIIVETTDYRYYMNIKGDINICLSGDEFVVSQKDVSNITELVTRSSIYAYSRYINEGFITLPGGNRVGVAGDTVFENGKICAVNRINSLVFRLSHEKKGIADLVIDDIYSNGRISNTLIISPPGCGKTTLLRDIARNLASHKTNPVICALIDERYELACAVDDQPGLDIGQSSFAISGLPKHVAIPMVVRTMSPDVIIADEICGMKDYEVIEYALSSGCKFIATVHGKDENNNEIKCCYTDKKIFEYQIVLGKEKGVGTINKIIRAG